MSQEVKKTHQATWVPPGHRYSPIPSPVQILMQEERLFAHPTDFYGIDLKLESQVGWLDALSQYKSEFPFTPNPQDSYRFYLNNSEFSHGDSMVYYGMLRHLKPRRVIDMSNVYSLSLLMDVNDQYFDSGIDLTVIKDPRAQHLGLDQIYQTQGIVVKEEIFHLSTDEIRSLMPNDILFLDTSHVSKMSSDLNYLVHYVLPLLEAGVYVHFHDIFSNFHYPTEWVTEGRAWNESYLLRSFLMFNEVFEVVLFNSYLGHHHRPWFEQNWPEFLHNTGGSLWIKKVK